MKPEIVVPSKILTSFIRAHPDWIFLYSDAFFNKGGLGQSIYCHGEPNAIRIPTCYKYCSNPIYYDDRIEDYWNQVRSSFDNIPLDTVVIPFPKMGLGHSRMKEFAPRLFEFMQSEIKRVSYPNIKWNYGMD